MIKLLAQVPKAMPGRSFAAPKLTEKPIILRNRYDKRSADCKTDLVIAALESRATVSARAVAEGRL